MRRAGSLSGRGARLILSSLAAPALLILQSCGTPAKSNRGLAWTDPPGAVVELGPLLEASGSVEAASRADLREIEQIGRRLKQDAPSWPTYAWLLAEIHRLRGDTATARREYRGLAAWAASDPYGDHLGGSSLAGAALWRWLQSIQVDGTPDKAEAIAILRTADELRDRRLVRDLYATPVLEALPQLQEDTARLLALLAWRIGDQAQALQLFLEYLAIARTDTLGEAEGALMERLVTSRIATPDHLQLMRGKRLLAVGNYRAASELLEAVSNGTDPDARAEARVFLARTLRIQGVPLTRVLPVLSAAVFDATDPGIAELALYERALVENREGPGRDPEQYSKDLLELVSKYPRGDYTAQALYELGRYFQDADDNSGALEYFEKARAFGGKNDRAQLATFQEALLLYLSGGPESTSKAVELLHSLAKAEPATPLRSAALFWQARIAEEARSPSSSLFERVVAENPFDYYGIRARMHLRSGLRACRDLLPADDVKRQIHDAHRPVTSGSATAPRSAYHTRLQVALDTKAYGGAFEANAALRQLFPGQRLEGVPLADLDKAGILSRIAVLLALRQDARTAAALSADPADRLRIADAVGTAASDWPLTISLAMATGEPYERQLAVQRDPRYLTVAYPAGYLTEFSHAAADRGINTQLLYVVARLESLLSPTALSRRGGLGLFQFTPSTFRELDSRWHVLQSSGTRTAEEFLLNPRLSIQLGARWFADELIPRHGGNIFLAVLDHNAGASAVASWLKAWQRLDRVGDVEFMVESIRFSETRIFVRRVLTDVAITEAIGLFGNSSQ